MFADDLQLAAEKQQMVSVKIQDGRILIGLPQMSQQENRVRIVDEGGAITIPFEDIVHVMRLINFS
ncbi:hypothetical protein EJP77_10050 [Paenibacillus zeisoli]|uniref:Uncharacterized protein n=1 Tax=Paenibacillus zeisoli TaxID=2496267 RepID=A0A3S1D9T4_9BACL|nr:hypothetical protein [Paenibacillus zeisoli]RUT31722.1 hypothetical protein EJP77_10050 [Paenibacillus zeisoli]